jgi:hypothetical protein
MPSLLLWLLAALADGHQIGHAMAEDSVSARLSPEQFREQLHSTAAALRRRGYSFVTLDSLVRGR